MIILGVAVVGIVGWELWRGYKKNKRDDEANKAGDAAAGDIERLEGLGYRRTLSNSQLEAMIIAMEEAMNDCGTDEDAIMNSMSRLNNDLDFLYLVNHWGVRYYRPCAAWQPISYAKWLLDATSFPGDLPTWFNYDLNQSEIGEVNEILEGKGINFRV